MPYSITREDPARDAGAIRDACQRWAYLSNDAEFITILRELADSIEEQVKPVLEEPTGDVLLRVFGLTYKRQTNGEWWPVDSVGSGYEWPELVAELESINGPLAVYRREEYDPILQQVRDLLFRSPSGSLTPEEIGTAYKALRKGLSGILSDFPQSDDGATPPAADGLTPSATGVSATSAATPEAPSSADPMLFGSVVRAGIDEHSARILWCRTRSGGWFSEEGTAVAAYSYLHNPEVLRTGIADTDTYEKGRLQGESHLRRVLVEKVGRLLADAITGERKDAYAKALALIEEEL